MVNRSPSAIRQQQVATNQHWRLALQQAESATQAKTRFLASASHDLRQPKHTLSWFRAALMMRPLDPATTDIARHMNLAVQSLTSQMDAVLDKTRWPSARCSRRAWRRPRLKRRVKRNTALFGRVESRAGGNRFRINAWSDRRCCEKPC